MNQGSFVMDNLENLGVSEVERLVKDVANLYAGSAAGVIRIVSENNA